ncbi:MAG: NGG1p interacting factor NIF3 [bacterium]|nr:NGG1p interacting factor NIF3 [bacterium]
MKLGEIYDLFVKKGIDADPRGRKEIEKNLKKAKEKYDKLDKKKKDEFDAEKLSNPFADTRVLFGGLKTEVKTVLVGIDMEVPEILLADRLNEKGQKIDLVIAHHPEGKALAGLGGVMNVQADIFYHYGVPINVAEGVMAGRIGEISRAVAPANHDRAVDAARILDIPFMCTHTVADNHVHTFVEKFLEKKKPETVGDVIEALKEIPEYKAAAKIGAGPKIFAGSSSKRAGRVAVTGMTGGTEGGKGIYAKMAQAGVGTIIVMHISEDHKKEAEKCHVNVVVAGHMASDSLGMNLLLDEIEKKGVKVIPTSGLIRVKR